MTSGDVAFMAMAASPIGGLLIAIPYAAFELGYPMGLILALGIPLAYLQVLVVDRLWTVLGRWARWQRLMERLRSPRIERVLAARGGFWVTLLSTPLVGPWVVMAFMRYAHVPHRKVALPIFLGLCVAAGTIAAICLLAPEVVGHGR